MSEIKTRFAPSPTGYMHIGNLRTALYAYLTARCLGGKFILRIEDTDQDRKVDGAVQVIYDTLKIAGLHNDEGPDCGGPNGPYVQSERLEIYRKYAEQLVEQGDAYYCFCTKDRLAALHEEQENPEYKGRHGYDGHCRDLPKEEVEALLAAGTPHVIRQRVPQDGVTGYHDVVFGDVSVPNSELQDIVLIKADGFPTYNFAHVVDDHLMEVTHVTRGNEYVAQTPAYILIYRAFGWEHPTYIHLPLIMGKDAEGNVSKLSKRHGSVSFQDMLQDGYMPEAIINYIALLGWNPKTDEEMFTLAELESRFSPEAINKSPAIFDYDKLLWFNGQYIRKLSAEDFYEKALPYIRSAVKNEALDGRKIAALLQQRLEKMTQIPGQLMFFDSLPEYENELYVNGKSKSTLETAPVALAKSIEVLEALDEWTNEKLYYALKDVATELGMKANTVMWAVRIAATGTLVTPGGATDVLDILGKEESLKRLKNGLARF
ncbi:MAG: glutamate--tRNA ligase [Planctomycetia bacterium]|nr:glutamate--tRNA ligase [Planctomycetia bacterium]